MSDQNASGSPFEAIRHTTKDDREYWSGREQAKVPRGEVVSFANVRTFAEILRVTPEQLQREEPK